MQEKTFIDSNIWIYLLTDDTEDKKASALRVVSKQKDKVVSWQVINEVSATLIRKAGCSENFVTQVVRYIAGSCEIVEFSLDTLTVASLLRQQHSISFWDSLIVAAALQHKCSLLLSEDMQDGKRIANLLIRNPLASTYNS